MFEDDVDGIGVPCDHPLRWYDRLMAWAHCRIEDMRFIDRQKWHDRLPGVVCEAYERVGFGFPCHQCEEDRSREYGATVKTDEDVIARFPQLPDMPFDYQDGDGRDRVEDDSDG